MTAPPSPPDPDNPPPRQTPNPVDYQRPLPQQLQPVTGRSVGRFALRALIGCVLSICAVALGVYLAYLVGQIPGLMNGSGGSIVVVIFAAPSILLFTGLLIVTIRRRAFGFLTGWVASFFLIVIGLVLLVASICGFFK